MVCVQTGDQTILKWELRGSHLDSLQLTLSPLGQEATSPPSVLANTLTLAVKYDTAVGRSAACGGTVAAGEEARGAYVLHGMVALHTSHDQLMTITNRYTRVFMMGVCE